MNIGDVSERSGLPAKTIRYQEDIGLVRPSRSENGYRDFGSQDLHKLALLARARSLGFTIEECRTLAGCSSRSRSVASPSRFTRVLMTGSKGCDDRRAPVSCGTDAAPRLSSDRPPRWQRRTFSSVVFQPSASTTALPHVTVSADPPKSFVRNAGAERTRSIAETISDAASGWPRWSSIIAPAQI